MSMKLVQQSIKNAKFNRVEKKTIRPGEKVVTFKDGCKVSFHFEARLSDDKRTLIDDSRKIGPGKPIELILGQKFKLEVWEIIVQTMAINEIASFVIDKSVFFHFQARLCDSENTVLDDSRKLGPGKPIELVLGKKFKLEVWEVIVQKMALNEVASFTIDKSLVVQYPFVSKALRDAYSNKEHRQNHCCAMMLQNEGVGYDDLNVLLKDPANIEFIIELLKVEQPDEYEKESWQMSDDEKLKAVPILREDGNKLFKVKDYTGAEKLYAKAIGILEQLMVKEKPHDKEWNKLNSEKIPLLLNFSQCKLNECDFYAAIEHCTTVLDSEPDNVKALFRRGKAHIGAWNPEKARADLQKVMELDASLTTLIKKELQILEEEQRKKDEDDKIKLKNLFK